MRNLLLFTCLFLIFHSSFAQIGGRSAYEFLSLTQSARVAALGGESNAIWEDDINLAFHNPALLTQVSPQSAVINYVNYFSDLNYGYASYAWKSQKKGMFSAGIQYFNYGEFIAADEKGLITGDFKAAEYAMHLMYARTLKDSTWFIGATVKPIYSHLEKYNSLGLATDIGISYRSPNNLVVSMVIKNLGTQITTYASNYEYLPLNIQLGVSKKLNYAPIRFSIVLDHLESPILSYDSELTIEQNTDPLTGEEIQPSTLDQIADEVMRHVILGIEFTPFKNFYLRGGYNYRRRQELLIESRTSTIGFSYGFGIKFSNFYLNYGRSTYHLAGASDFFTISTNLSSFYK